MQNVWPGTARRNFHMQFRRNPWQDDETILTAHVDSENGDFEDDELDDDDEDDDEIEDEDRRVLASCFESTWCD